MYKVPLLVFSRVRFDVCCRSCYIVRHVCIITPNGFIQIPPFTTNDSPHTGQCHDITTLCPAISGQIGRKGEGWGRWGHPIMPYSITGSMTAQCGFYDSISPDSYQSVRILTISVRRKSATPTKDPQGANVRATAENREFMTK